MLVTYRPLPMVEYLYSKSCVSVVMLMDAVGFRDDGFLRPAMLMLYMVLGA